MLGGHRAVRRRHHHHAAERVALLRQLGGRFAQQPLDGAARGGLLLEGTAPEAARAVAVELDGLEEQVLLVAEGRVQARRGDAHRRGEIADGSGVVAALPEHVHRLLERCLAIERQRPAPRARRLLRRGCAGVIGLLRSFHSVR
jgi:hypothetical protein